MNMSTHALCTNLCPSPVAQDHIVATATAQDDVPSKQRADTSLDLSQPTNIGRSPPSRRSPTEAKIILRSPVVPPSPQYLGYTALFFQYVPSAGDLESSQGLHIATVNGASNANGRWRRGVRSVLWGQPLELERVECQTLYEAVALSEPLLHVYVHSSWGSTMFRKDSIEQGCAVRLPYTCDVTQKSALGWHHYSYLQPSSSVPARRLAVFKMLPNTVEAGSQ